MNSTYKVVPIGDGTLYGWAQFDSKGNKIRTSEQTFPTDADAEKAIRAIATSNDVIEVTDIKNITPSANRNVNLVRDPVDEADKNAGMKVVTEGIEEKLNPESEDEGKGPKNETRGIMSRRSDTESEKKK